jgi:carnitine-CoA ligase
MKQGVGSMKSPQEGSTNSPPWFDAAMPSREAGVLGPLLESGANAHPDRVFAIFEDGPQWTYADTLALTRRGAQGLQQLGVKKSDAVLAWLPNGPDMVRSWFATCYLGAVFTPVNVAYRGDLLEHVVNNSGAKILVAHADLVERLRGLNLPQLETIVVVGDIPPVDLRVTLLTDDVLDGDESRLLPIDSVEPWDTMAIIYTSGTTGPSKGVLCSYFHYYTVGTLAIGFIEEHERCLISMPLFHLAGTGSIYGALVRHASVAVVEGFSTEKFWDQIRKFDCATHCGLVGSVVAFLAKREPAADDRDNPLRRVMVAPADDRIRELAKRHDFDFFTGFGMSEAPMPLMSELNPAETGYCGRVRSGMQCRIVDENDIEVQAGTVGELIVRADLPWSLNSGYVNAAEETAKAWRNGWFHTGDGFYKDTEGRYFFVDRLKDAIRRRGENISSLEVEQVVLAHPDVLDAAAIPVPSELSEDEVMVVVQPKSGRTIDPVALIGFLTERMAHFMVPRYVRCMEALPKTPTNKVQKALLREQGVTADTWDREAAGIVLKRQRLE